MLQRAVAEFEMDSESLPPVELDNFRFTQLAPDSAAIITEVLSNI